MARVSTRTTRSRQLAWGLIGCLQRDALRSRVESLKANRQSGSGGSRGVAVGIGGLTPGRKSVFRRVRGTPADAKAPPAGSVWPRDPRPAAPLPRHSAETRHFPRLLLAKPGSISHDSRQRFNTVSLTVLLSPDSGVELPVPFPPEFLSRLSSPTQLSVHFLFCFRQTPRTPDRLHCDNQPGR